MALADALATQGRSYLKKEGRHRYGVTLTTCLPRAYVQFFKPGNGSLARTTYNIVLF